MKKLRQTLLQDTSTFESYNTELGIQQMSEKSLQQHLPQSASEFES